MTSVDETRGITEEYWATLHEDRKLCWDLFSQATAFVAALFVLKTGVLFVDIVIGIFTAFTPRLIVRSQRALSKHSEGEVALMFTYKGEQDGRDEFDQPAWKREVEPFYELGSILGNSGASKEPEPDSWRFGCLQRIRAFGIYEQSHLYEYPLALIIALWRWCKFDSDGEADRGRRVTAFALAVKLIRQIEERDRGQSYASA